MTGETYLKVRPRRSPTKLDQPKEPRSRTYPKHVAFNASKPTDSTSNTIRSVASTAARSSPLPCHHGPHRCSAFDTIISIYRHRPLPARAGIKPSPAIAGVLRCNPPNMGARQPRTRRDIKHSFVRIPGRAPNPGCFYVPSSPCCSSSSSRCNRAFPGHSAHRSANSYRVSAAPVSPPNDRPPKRPQKRS